MVEATHQAYFCLVPRCKGHYNLLQLQKLAGADGMVDVLVSGVYCPFDHPP